MKQFTLTHSLGQIVATYPGAGDFFMDQHIDFCCGGDRTLGDAIQADQLNEAEILAPLNLAYLAFQERNEVFSDWANADMNRLIEHILTAHHQFLRQEMPQISALLFKLLGVHGTHHEELFEIHKLFNTLRMELEAHMIKEEEWLFPAIETYSFSSTSANLKAVTTQLEALEAEHEGAGNLLKSLRGATDHYTVPQDGCPTYTLAFTKLKALEKNTFEHVHLENNILFKNLV